MKFYRNSQYRPPTRKESSPEAFKTQKERKSAFFDRTEDFCKQLITELQQNKPGKMQELMKFFSSKAANWSAANILGLYLQRPDCHRPVTIREAKAFGHTPKKGVRCAEILVPCIVRPKEEPEPQPQEDRDEGQRHPAATESPSEGEADSQQPAEVVAPRIYFKLVACVLDLGYDTEGPKLLGDEKADQVEAEKLLAAAKSFAASEGILNLSDHGLKGEAGRAVMTSVNGAPFQPAIQTSSVLAADAAFTTYIHELAHVKLQHLEKLGEMEKKTMELQAEAISYVVAQHFGVPADYASEYLKHWGVTSKAIMDNLRTIGKTSRDIIHGIQRQLNIGISEEVEAAPIEEVDEAAYEAQYRGQTISVYQKIDQDFSQPEWFVPEDYQQVAVINDTNPGEAFSLTNSVDGRWQSADDPRIEVLVPRSRNSSIGDVFYVAETDDYKVATRRGFESIPSVSEEIPQGVSM